MKDLCAEFGISRQTGYLWLKRYQAGGSQEMADRSRRPSDSPKRTAEEVEQTVVEMRRKWPDWGAAKLARVLSQQKPAIIVQPRTVHRILDRYALIEPQDRRQRALKRFERNEPNELWQMDFKGPYSGAPVPWARFQSLTIIAVTCWHCGIWEVHAWRGFAAR